MKIDKTLLIIFITILFIVIVISNQILNQKIADLEDKKYDVIALNMQNEIKNTYR